MLIKFLIISYLFRGLQTHKTLGGYTIVAPGTIRSNSEYHVSVSLDSLPQSCWFNISLEVFSFADLYSEIVGAATIVVDPGTTQLVKMQLPKLFHGQGDLTVTGYSGIISKESSSVHVEESRYAVYIQTDKSKYRAGDMVQFRLIFVDRFLRPTKVDSVIDVNIYDGDKNFIRKFANVKLVQGVFKGDFKLSDYPVLGEWTIEVTDDGAILKEELFQVAKYILPKFSVEINTKRNVAVEEAKIVINVKSKYIFGKPVNGNLTVILNSTYETNPHLAVQKTKLFSGETAISFEFDKDLYIARNAFLQYSSHSYVVTATVVEGLTDESHSATAEVVVHFQPYKVKINSPQSFNVHDLLNITVSVTDLNDNPIRDTNSPVNITFTHYDYNMEKLLTEVDIKTFDYRFPEPIRKTVYLNGAGVGVLTLQMPDEPQFSKYQVTAEYLGSISYPRMLERSYLRVLNVDILTESPMVGRDLVFKVWSTDPIGYFVYEVVSRGNIIQSQRINVPNNMKTHVHALNITHSMVPKIILFVHRIKSGTLNPHIKEVYIKAAFENSINITAEEEVRPGALTSLNVATDTGSYVGLIGIDESLLLLENEYKASLSEDRIFGDLHKYDNLAINNQIFPGREAGLIAFSNAHNRAGVVIGHPGTILIDPESISAGPERFKPPSFELPRIRKLFTDGWMFKDFERSPEAGLRLREIIPDTITSWAITGFSLNPDTGLALTKNVTKIRVVQPFFISMDLPSSIKEGEILEIKVYVYNYMDKDLLTDVTMSSPGADIEFLDGHLSERSLSPNQTFTKPISTNRNEKFVFIIRPRKSGCFNLTVKAISGDAASDAVQKTLLVNPDGITYSISKTYLVHHTKEYQEQNYEIFVEIPNNYVPSSESVQITVVGDIFGVLIRNLQNLVRVPFGNGESNIRLMVSNLMVLKYLKTLNHSIPSLESKAKLFLALGYQTQMSFLQLDGSFSLFDRRVERTGDIWLSAYTMWVLQQSKDFIKLDGKVIDRGLDYVKRKQTANGGYHSAKGLEEDVSLTALAILACLVEEKTQILHQDSIAKGLSYLYDVLDELEQPASVAIAMYTLVLGKHEKSKTFLDKLGTNVALRSRQLQWTTPDTIKSILETTTYSFLGLLESQEASLETLYPIIHSLASAGQGKRTPGHILALEAMIKLARNINFGFNDLSIQYQDDQGQSGGFHVNTSHPQVLQQLELKKSSRHVKFETKGKGIALVTVNYKYNMFPEQQTSLNFETNVTIKELTDWSTVFDICIAIKPPLSHSNLTIMSVNLLSGYTVYEGSFERIKETNKLVKIIDIDRSDQTIKVYLEKIPQSGTCIQLGGAKTFTIYNQKPISIFVYDVESDSR